MEEETIHMVIPPSSNQTDLDTKIHAIAWKKRTVEGVTKYGITNYSGCNILSMLEASSAKYWQQIIDEAKITHDQAVAWVQHLEQVTGDTYFHRVTNNVKISSTAFICGIAKASRNFSVTNSAYKQYPEKIQLILKPIIVDMPNNFYSKCHKEAQNMEQAIIDGKLDDTFIHYLSRATGAKMPS